MATGKDDKAKAFAQSIADGPRASEPDQAHRAEGRSSYLIRAL
jgi:hypothetical protein